MTGRDQLQELAGDVFEWQTLIEYQPGSIVSRTLVDEDDITLTAFAFDDTQRISEHSAAHDAILQVVDGTGKITINSDASEVEAGETIVLPANEPHSVEAVTQFKMILTMIR